MKYFAYSMAWIATAAVIICAIIFEDAVWTVLGLFVPLCIAFPKEDSEIVAKTLVSMANAKKIKED